MSRSENDKVVTSVVNNFEIVLTARGDGIVGGDVTILSVHVVRAGTRIVTQPHTVILDTIGGIRFLNLFDLNNLTVGLLDFLETTQKVPEARLGHNVIGRKDGHSVERWVRVGLVHQVTTHNAILAQLKSNLLEQSI